MRNLPPLNALKAFEASGRHLNFRMAAEELGVTQGAVAQQVRTLEARLKVQLFERHARGLTLTDEGRRFLPSLTQAFDLITEASQDLVPGNLTATISTTPSFATRWLVPRLGALTADLPDLQVRLDASNSFANFQTDGVDIAIRQGRPPFVGLDHDLLFGAELIAVCHPDLPNKDAPLSQPQDLQAHTLLQDAHGQWLLFLSSVFGDHVPSIKMTRFSQTSLTIDAALAGQGVALTNRAFVANDLENGRLIQPFEHKTVTQDAFYFVAPRRPRQPKIVASLRAWFLSQI